MGSILDKLQEEAGLSKEQAMKVLTVMKDFMDKENIHLDWERMFKDKYEDMKNSASSFFSKISAAAKDFAGSVGDQVEDLTDDAKEKLKDIKHKLDD